jgi:ethanolamine utilization protein EutM
MQDAIGLARNKGLGRHWSRRPTAMAKAANVADRRSAMQIGGGLVTTVVRGDVGSVRAAVEAGANAATQSRRTRRQPHHPAARRRLWSPPTSPESGVGKDVRTVIRRGV